MERTSPELTVEPPLQQETYIDLPAMLATLWHHRLLGITLVVLALAATVLFLRFSQEKYTAQLVIVSAEGASAGSKSNLASLGALVGVDIGAQSASRFAMFPDAVYSLEVAEDLASDEAFLRRIFRDRWDEQRRTWTEPERGAIKSGLKSLLGMEDRAGPPGAAQLKLFIAQNVEVAESDDRPTITISFEHSDRRLAAELVRRVYERSDLFLRRMALARAASYTNYLERRLAEVQVAEYRQALTEAIANYEKTRMMASSDASFAAESFGSVWVSPTPTSPRAPLVLALGAIGGLALWFVYVLIVRPLARDAAEHLRTGA